MHMHLHVAQFNVTGVHCYMVSGPSSCLNNVLLSCAAYIPKCALDFCFVTNVHNDQLSLFTWS